MSLFGKKTYNYITNEIDYEKLAKAIVKANEEIENKKQKPPSVLTTSMAICVAVLLFVLTAITISFLSIFVEVYVIFLQEVTMSSMNLSSWLRTLLLSLLIIAALASISVALFISGFEILWEKERDFIMSAFSGIVGFVALIIALLAISLDNSGEIMEVLLRIETFLQG